VNGQTQPKNLLITLAVVLLAALPWVCPRLGLGRSAAPATTRSIVDAEDDAPSRPVRQARAERLGTAPGGRIATLHLADLERVPRGSTAGRDPWRFVDPPPQRRQPDAKPEPSFAAAAPVAIQTDLPPHPREFNLRYLGHFGPPDKQLAVFADGNAVFNKQEGEVIDNQFIVTHIGHESVDIRFVGFPDAPPQRIGVTSRRATQLRGNPG
jgi:hypothetical protein